MRLVRVLSFFTVAMVLGFKAYAQDARFMVEIAAKNVSERSKIANIIHMDSVFENRVYAVVNQKELADLELSIGANLLTVEVLSIDDGISDYFRPFVGEFEFPDGESDFHTYQEMIDALRMLEEEYPGLAYLSSIGTSIEGRDIWSLRISNDDANEPGVDKPGIAYMGTHHAREHISTEMPIKLAAELLNRHDSDADIQALLASTEIHIIPMVNPDGAMHDVAGQRYKWWRKNRRPNHDGTYGVDLNRNYGYGFGTGGSSSDPSSEIYMGTEAFSEPETAAIRDFFVDRGNISIALSFHTYSELILYPWGGQNAGVGGEDEQLFKTMAEEMAQMNGYRPMQSSALYVASGDTCDWLYGELGVYCFTFELSPASMFDGGFYPGADIIDEVFSDNLSPMLYLASYAAHPSAVIKR